MTSATSDKIRTLYDSVAMLYAERFCSREVLDAEECYIEQLFSIGVLSQSVLLDVGCGPAVYLPLAERHSVKYIGIDFSLGMLGAGRIRFPEAVLVQGDARLLPVLSRSVNFAVAMGSLSHMPDADFRIAINEISRTLCSNGGFLLGDQIGTHAVRLPYPLSPGPLIPVFPRTEGWYCDVLTDSGFAIQSKEVRDPGPGEIALQKVLIWASVKQPAWSAG